MSSQLSIKISKITIFKGAVHEFFEFREISVSFGNYSFAKFRSVSFREISEKFRIFIFRNLFLNCLSHFKSIINDNQEIYTSEK